MVPALSSESVSLSPSFSQMARDVSLNSVEDSECCRYWREKCAKSEEKRNALRQAVNLLVPQLDIAQAECASHKNACELERARADLERKEKENLAKVQTELEENICSLKLEVSLLGSADSNLEEKVKLLEANITKGEVEIKNLKELLKKEKSRADSERKNALSEKKRSIEELKALEAEKSKADKKGKISTEERKKFEQSRVDVDKLKKEVEGFRSRLVIETVKYEETSKKHELERQKTLKEKKRADEEKDRADKQRRLTDESNRKLMEENAHVVKLCEEVQAGKQKIKKLQEEINKLLGYLNRSLLDEKDHADKFSNDVMIEKKLLEHANKLPLATGKTKALGTSSTRQDNGLSESFPSVLFGEAIGNLNCQKEKASIITEPDSELMKESGRLDVAQKSRKRVLEESNVGNLSKDLAGKRQRTESFQHQEQVFQKPASTCTAKSSRSKKVENMKLKLCKEQLKFEKMKTKHAKEVLEFERCRNSILSKEIRQMRFDFGQYTRRLDMLDSFASPDSGGVSRVGKNVRKYMDALKNNQHGSEPFHSCSLVDTELFQPSGRGSSSDFISGTDSQLEFSRGSYLRKNFQSSALNSVVASFSDRGFLGSQEKACSRAAMTKMVDDEEVETRCIRKDKCPAENVAHSSLQEGDCRIETLEQKRVKSVELTGFRDAMCMNANKELYGLDNNMECGEEYYGRFHSDLEGVFSLIDTDFHYMRLLELDDLTDENRYKLATERLLSPLHDSDLEVFEANAVMENVSQRFGPPENDNHFVLSTVNVVESRLRESKLDYAPSETEIFACSFGKQYGCALGTPPEFCVISSDVKDIESISNIFKATRSCMVQTSSPSQTGSPVPKVSIISLMEDNLQAKEKICVFFTVLLLKLSHAWPGSGGCGLNRAMLNCVDSFNELLITVMDDDKTRSLFEEEWQIDYLIHMIEDFLVDGRVAWVPNTCSRPIVTSTRGLGIALNGNDGLFLSKTACTNMVLGGGIVLASICAVTNNIGFICEASYRIFQVLRSDTSLLLTILHAFSYICGKHYFTYPSYTSLMAVVKSLVTYTEDSFMPENSGSCPMPLDGLDAGSSSCIRCPFRAEAVSVDEITFLLLEKVAKTILPCTVEFDGARPFCSLKSGRPHFEDSDRNNACAGCFPTVSVSNVDLNVRRPICRYVIPAVPTEKKLNDNLNDNIELLSLLELIANVVGWEFTQNKIIPSLLNIFKSSVSVPVATGVMVLIGRLGRTWAVAHGYDDVRVDTLRSDLCDAVRLVGASDPSFTIVMAVLNALLSLLPIKFARIVEDEGGNLTWVSQSQSLAASSIRKWYSSLSRERQVLAHSILLSTTPEVVER